MSILLSCARLAAACAHIAWSIRARETYSAIRDADASRCGKFLPSALALLTRQESPAQRKGQPKLPFRCL